MKIGEESSGALRREVEVVRRALAEETTALTRKDGGHVVLNWVQVVIMLLTLVFTVAGSTAVTWYRQQEHEKALREVALELKEIRDTQREELRQEDRRFDKLEKSVAAQSQAVGYYRGQYENQKTGLYELKNLITGWRVDVGVRLKTLEKEHD